MFDLFADVGILVIDSTAEEAVYSMNTVLGQTYTNISILLILKQRSLLSLQKVLEVLSFNKKDNIKNIFVEILKDITDYSNSVLDDLIKKDDTECSVRLGNSVIYNWKGEYCSEIKNSISPESISVDGSTICTAGIKASLISEGFGI